MFKTSKMITWEDFEKIDIRVGTVLSVEEFPRASKPSYRLSIDFGVLGIKKSAAQITVLYDIKDLIGKQIIAVVNFPPKQIANFISECLVLGIVGVNNEITLLSPDTPTPNGLKIA